MEFIQIYDSYLVQIKKSAVDFTQGMDKENFRN